MRLLGTHKVTLRYALIPLEQLRMPDSILFTNYDLLLTIYYFLITDSRPLNPIHVLKSIL